MSDFARLLIVVILIALAGISGYGFRGWQDGTFIPRAEADLIAQGRADEAASAAVKIKSANDATREALKRVQAPARVVSLECPPGLGAVSDEALARLRAVSK